MYNRDKNSSESDSSHRVPFDHTKTSQEMKEESSGISDDSETQSDSKLAHKSINMADLAPIDSVVPVNDYNSLEQSNNIDEYTPKSELVANNEFNSTNKLITESEENSPEQPIYYEQGINDSKKNKLILSTNMLESCVKSIKNQQIASNYGNSNPNSEPNSSTLDIDRRVFDDIKLPKYQDQQHELEKSLFLDQSLSQKQSESKDSDEKKEEISIKNRKIIYKIISGKRHKFKYRKYSDLQISPIKRVYNDHIYIKPSKVNNEAAYYRNLLNDYIDVEQIMLKMRSIERKPDRLRGYFSDTQIMQDKKIKKRKIKRLNKEDIKTIIKSCRSSSDLTLLDENFNIANFSDDYTSNYTNDLYEKETHDENKHYGTEANILLIKNKQNECSDTISPKKQYQNPLCAINVTTSTTKTQVGPPPLQPIVYEIKTPKFFLRRTKIFFELISSYLNHGCAMYKDRLGKNGYDKIQDRSRFKGKGDYILGGGNNSKKNAEYNLQHRNTEYSKYSEQPDKINKRYRILSVTDDESAIDDRETGRDKNYDLSPQYYRRSNSVSSSSEYQNIPRKEYETIIHLEEQKQKRDFDQSNDLRDDANDHCVYKNGITSTHGQISDTDGIYHCRNDQNLSLDSYKLDSRQSDIIENNHHDYQKMGEKFDQEMFYENNSNQITNNYPNIYRILNPEEFIIIKDRKNSDFKVHESMHNGDFTNERSNKPENIYEKSLYPKLYGEMEEEKKRKLLNNVQSHEIERDTDYCRLGKKSINRINMDQQYPRLEEHIEGKPNHILSNNLRQRENLLGLDTEYRYNDMNSESNDIRCTRKFDRVSNQRAIREKLYHQKHNNQQYIEKNENNTNTFMKFDRKGKNGQEGSNGVPISLIRRLKKWSLTPEKNNSPIDHYDPNRKIIKSHVNGQDYHDKKSCEIKAPGKDQNIMQNLDGINPTNQRKILPYTRENASKIYWNARYENQKRQKSNEFAIPDRIPKNFSYNSDDELPYEYSHEYYDRREMNPNDYNGEDYDQTPRINGITSTNQKLRDELIRSQINYRENSEMAENQKNRYLSQNYAKIQNSHFPKNSEENYDSQETRRVRVHDAISSSELDAETIPLDSKKINQYQNTTKDEKKYRLLHLRDCFDEYPINRCDLEGNFHNQLDADHKNESIKKREYYENYHNGSHWDKNCSHDSEQFSKDECNLSYNDHPSRPEYSDCSYVPKNYKWYNKNPYGNYYPKKCDYDLPICYNDSHQKKLDSSTKQHDNKSLFYQTKTSTDNLKYRQNVESSGDSKYKFNIPLCVLEEYLKKFQLNYRDGDENNYIYGSEYNSESEYLRLHNFSSDLSQESYNMEKDITSDMTRKKDFNDNQDSLNKNEYLHLNKNNFNPFDDGKINEVNTEKYYNSNKKNLISHEFYPREYRDEEIIRNGNNGYDLRYDSNIDGQNNDEYYKGDLPSINGNTTIPTSQKALYRLKPTEKYEMNGYYASSDHGSSSEMVNGMGYRKQYDESDKYKNIDYRDYLKNRYTGLNYIDRSKKSSVYEDVYDRKFLQVIPEDTQRLDGYSDVQRNINSNSVSRCDSMNNLRYYNSTNEYANPHMNVEYVGDKCHKDNMGGKYAQLGNNSENYLNNYFQFNGGRNVNDPRNDIKAPDNSSKSDSNYSDSSITHDSENNSPPDEISMQRKPPPLRYIGPRSNNSTFDYSSESSSVIISNSRYSKINSGSGDSIVEFENNSTLQINNYYNVNLGNGFNVESVDSKNNLNSERQTSDPCDNESPKPNIDNLHDSKENDTNKNNDKE